MNVLASAAAKPAYLNFGFAELGETVLRFADGVELVSYRMQAVSLWREPGSRTNAASSV